MSVPYPCSSVEALPKGGCGPIFGSTGLSKVLMIPVKGAYKLPTASDGACFLFLRDYSGAEEFVNFR